MPRLDTQYFGTLEYDPKSLLHFPSGLPGFDSVRYFLPIEQPATHPLLFLQNRDAIEPCFVTLPVELVRSDYALKLSAADLENLGVEESDGGNQLLCLVMVSMNESGWTANLLAPVVANLKLGRAVQVIQEESDYSHQHPLTAGDPC